MGPVRITYHSAFWAANSRRRSPAWHMDGSDLILVNSRFGAEYLYSEYPVFLNDEEQGELTWRELYRGYVGSYAVKMFKKYGTTALTHTSITNEVAYTSGFHRSGPNNSAKRALNHMLLINPGKYEAFERGLHNREVREEAEKFAELHQDGHFLDLEAMFGRTNG